MENISSFMERISDFIVSLADFMWGTWMTVLLVSTGIILSFLFRFCYQTKIGFHFKNTYLKMFRKGEGIGTVSGFAAACTALANTVGTGNISGVATAVTMGGPGAVFWMWVSGLFGMSTKAAEIILGQRYRVKYTEAVDEYVCDRSFVMKNSLGWKKGGMVLAFFCFVAGPWTCMVQSEAVVNSLNEAFNVPVATVLILLGITVLFTIMGGLRRIAAIMEKVVPFMALAYVLMGLMAIVIYINKVPAAFVLIFKSAFNPMSAVGGFAGATVRNAIRYGIARGIYSNDAGTGYGMVAHAPAQTDHPVRQSSWGWGEVFVDTIVICTITALLILLTDSYILYPEATSGQLTTIAAREAFGRWGSSFLAVSIAIFAWTTIIGMYYSCEKSLNYFFGDTRKSRIVVYGYMVYYIIPAVFFAHLDVAIIWATTDVISACYALVTLLLIFMNWREILRLFDDFWNRFIPAIQRGESPAPVNYATVDEKARFI